MEAAQPPAKRHFAVHCVVAASNSALDVLLKNGVIVFAAYHGRVDAHTLSLVAALSWGLFMAPFFLLSAHAGYFGDRFDNRKLALALKGADLAIAAAAAYGFRSGDIVLLLGAVFAKGCTATLFSPIKYSLVVSLLPSARHGSGYALMEALSTAAILGGAYLGATLGADPDPSRIGLAAIGVAGASLLTAALYPPLPSRGGAMIAPGLDPVRPTLGILRAAHADGRAFSAILALSWFWALGAVYLSSIAPLVRDAFGGDQSQVAYILVTFTLGTSLGLASCAAFNRGRLAGRLGLVAAILIAAAGLGLQYAPPRASGLSLALFFTIAFASGVYAGHYSEILYRSAGDRAEARLFAANNIVSSLVMVLALGLSALILGLDVPVQTSLALFAAASIPITLLVGGPGRGKARAQRA